MNEKKIQDAINSVEPEAGAKERMYQNIMKKAQQQNNFEIQSPAPKKKRPIRFLRYALPIAACFCLFAIGIVKFLPENAPNVSKGTSAPSESSNVQMVNPFRPVESSEDFKAIGITLSAPAGAKNAEYTIVANEIAEIKFEADGKNYTLRASAKSDDFSGLYGEEEKSETVDESNNAVFSVITIDNSQYCKISWTNGKINYCLFGADGANEAQVKAVYEEVIK